MRALFIRPIALIGALISSAAAQLPAPATTQQTVPAAAVVPAAPAQVTPVKDTAALQATLKALLELRATNGNILKKQEATLLQLEELGKAAEQIKIYSKRG